MPIIVISKKHLLLALGLLALLGVGLVLFLRWDPGSRRKRLLRLWRWWRNMN